MAGKHAGLTLCDDKYAALQGADALVICTEWQQFSVPDFAEMATRMRSKVIVDGRNLYQPQKLQAEGWTYFSGGAHGTIKRDYASYGGTCLLDLKMKAAALPNLLLRLWHHLTHRRQRQFVLLMGLMLVSAFAEVVSLGAVLPFLGILVAPEHVFSHPIVADVAQAWGITSADQLVLPLTVAFIAAALIAGAIRILLLWVSTRLTVASGADLSIEAYRRTLYQPYRVHLARNSSEVISSNHNKLSYAYLLTPVGITEKTALTTGFLKRKLREYTELRAEIKALQQEVSTS